MRSLMLKTCLPRVTRRWSASSSAISSITVIDFPARHSVLWSLRLPGQIAHETAHGPVAVFLDGLMHDAERQSTKDAQAEERLQDLAG